LRYLVKHTRKAVAAKSASDAASFLTKAIKAYDKAAQNGVISKNLANRTKSRLSKAVRGIGKA
jgi:small subunit ribosomal protein S20